MERTNFPVRSVGTFAAAMLVLRGVLQVSLGAFPVHTPFQNVARILIGGVSVVAVAWLSRRLLAKDRVDKTALRMGVVDFPWFLGGGLLMVPLVLIVALGLGLLVPFRWVSGPLDPREVAWAFCEYFTGNALEELMFHGYLLVVVSRSIGSLRSLLVLAALFGLFHLPGLAGMAAIKMVCTTAAWSIVFGLAYVRTGTLWAAIGMHAFGNTLLHRIGGMSGEPSLFRIVFTGAWPIAYDPGFVVFVAVGITAAIALFVVPIPGRRR